MKALIIKIIACFLILGASLNLFCQEIEIDLTFTSDTVIILFKTLNLSVK
jgi:hypothetical protein